MADNHKRSSGNQRIAAERPIDRGYSRLMFCQNLTFKTLTPLVIIIILIGGLLGFYLSTSTKNQSKEFLIENLLIPEYSLLAKEKDDKFRSIMELTEFTAQKVEDKIQNSKNRTDKETDELFNKYMSKKPDGSYRSGLDKSRGRFQMAAFFNNKGKLDVLHKNIFVDAFQFFDAFSESLTPYVFTTYVASADSIWQYGFPDWALTSPANESFDGYNWFYDADPFHNPGKEHVWTDMYYDALQGQWMISSLMPVYDGEKFFGIIGQDFILQEIMQVTQKSDVEGGGILFFVDRLGNIIAHPETEYLIGEKAKNDEILNLRTIPDTALTKVLQTFQDKNSYAFTDGDNRRIVMSFPLESVGWRMVYVVDENEFLRIVDHTNKQYLSFFILFALFILVIVSLMIRAKVTDPIKKFTMVTDEISKGHFNKKINIHSMDEIGVLASSFNKMITDLKKSREELEKHSGTLEKQVRKRTMQLNGKIKELENSKLATMNMMEDLNTSFDKLKELDDLKTEFLTVSSHELRTPITPMRAQIQMILAGYFGKLTPQVKNSLNMILRNIDQFDHLVNDILDISKIESRAMKFNIQSSDIASIIETSVDTLKTKAATQKNVKITTDIAKLPKIMADSERVLQVVNNIINNAIKFNKTNGLIHVKAEKRARDILVSISDTGIGMAPEETKIVFDPFMQADSSRARKFEGTGLGLAIARGIVDYHGGEIWVESGLGKGSTFYFTLPLKHVKGKEKSAMELLGFKKEKIK